MRGRSAARTAWLSLTPEPERSLPPQLARLVGGADATDSVVKDEQDRISRLILRGTERSWLAYLDRAADLVLAVAQSSAAGDAQPALDVAQLVLDHDRMLIGMPGPGYDRMARRRRELASAAEILSARIDVSG